MAEGDGTTVDVDDVVGDRQVVHRRQADGGEGLVELEEGDVVDLLADPIEGRLDGAGGLGEQRGVGAGHLAVADDPAQRLAAELLGGGLGGHDDGGAAVGDLRGVAGGDVAGLVERGPQTGQRLGGGLAADALVGVEDDRVALALGDLDRDDLVVEQPVLGGAGGPLVGLGGQLVLGLASSSAEAAYFSVPAPMATWSKAQNRPSYIIESTTFWSPMR